MTHSRDHILTSHAGSLPRPDDLIEANRARESGGATDERSRIERRWRRDSSGGEEPGRTRR